MEKMIDQIAKECVAERLRKLNRVVTNVYDRALRPFGIKVSQMNLMVAAAKMGTARPLDVCQYLHLDASTLSRNVERMKNQGWLEAVPEEDRRSQPFRLTPQGWEVLKEAVPAWKEAQELVKSLLGEAALEQLDGALLRVSQANK